MDHIGGVTFHDLTTLVFWGQILQLILIDLILSGDNAVLIALACRNLPSSLQKKGILYGVLGAISLRIVFVFVISLLLKISFLKAAGGLLLLWIAVKLVIQDEEESEEVDSPDRLWAAVKTIIMADAVMSLDNVMAIAGVSGGKMALVLFGLLVSLPLVVYGSRILMVLMNRF
ncbi:MAG: YjbE family putative metal transport protein, partial [Syntrophomonadaceae bacterium]|nr:YjbE family putative metal transport protein [Syntrophomonadaceae bacterium]